MSGWSLRRSCLRTACAGAAAASAAAGLVAGPALAAQAHSPQRVTIVRPYRTKVSGTILFSVRGIKPGARRIVFSIDSRVVWSVGRLSPRLHRVTLIDTKRLRNGTHMLRIRVIYGKRRSVVVTKKIVVSNPRPKAPVQAHPAGAGGGTSGAAVGVFSPPAAPVPGPSVAEFTRESFDFSTTWPSSQEAGRYQVMVLSANNSAEIPVLKAINPNLKILLYQAVMLTNSEDPSDLQTTTGCTPYADDVANHPSWILHDQDGDQAGEGGYPGTYMTDVGNPGYQHACAANAAALAKQYGFAGIFWDTVNGSLDYTMAPGETVPEYPNNADWQSAMSSALAYLGPAMRAQGLLSVGNVGGASSVAQWDQWVGDLDGVEEESWTDAGQGLAQQIPYWSEKLTELSWAMANGKYELDHSWNGGEAANTYGLASMLLAASGRASYSTSNTNYGAQENWFPEYATAQSLGAPAGPYEVLSNGVYERAFSNGIVLVNPTANSVPTFSLGGSYSGSGLTNVQSVQLGPTSGLIMLDDTVMSRRRAS